jgi:hypothetical protein
MPVKSGGVTLTHSARNRASGLPRLATRRRNVHPEFSISEEIRRTTETWPGYACAKRGSDRRLGITIYNVYGLTAPRTVRDILASAGFSPGHDSLERND